MIFCIFHFLGVFLSIFACSFNVFGSKNFVRKYQSCMIGELTSWAATRSIERSQEVSKSVPEKWTKKVDQKWYARTNPREGTQPAGWQPDKIHSKPLSLFQLLHLAQSNSRSSLHLKGRFEGMCVRKKHIFIHSKGKPSFIKSAFLTLFKRIEHYVVVFLKDVCCGNNRQNNAIICRENLLFNLDNLTLLLGVLGPFYP